MKSAAAPSIPARKAVLKLAQYRTPDEGRAGKLRLDFNENTVGCSPAVLRALGRMTAAQMAMYPEYGIAARRLARFFRVHPAQMMLSNGIDDALHVISDTFIEAGDSVLIAEPTFDMYRFFAELAGARVVAVRYDEQMNFPVAEVLRKLRQTPRVLYIANPNNPTGSLVQPEDLRRILRAAPRTLVLVDEAYWDFSGTTVLPWIRRYRNLIVARTFSKSAGLAALRLGCLFASPEILNLMRRASTPYPVNAAALVAAVASIEDTKFIAKYTQDVLRSRALLDAGLQRLGARTFPSAANFILADFGSRARGLARKLARQGILVRERRDCGREGFIRISAGTPADTDRVLRAIAGAL